MEEAAVLLLTFNRADNAQNVFEAIRKAKVKKLYISNDAPRVGNATDMDAREQIKKMCDSVDWECEVHTLFHPTNLGCGKAVSSAITWAFQNEDSLIILEDDCVPSMPFFTFCNHCLEKYKNDTRVWMINGRSQHENDPAFHGYDYTFSLYSHCWGWATWKRVWERFDLRYLYIDKFVQEGGVYNVFNTKEESDFINKIYVNTLLNNREKYKTSWALPFDLYVLSNRGLCVTPRENLIHNIGLVGDHSNVSANKKEPYFYHLQASETFHITKEPQFIIANAEYCYSHYKKHMRNLASDNRIVRLLRRLHLR